MDKMNIFAGSANMFLGRKVAEYLGVELGGLERVRFSDGEIFVKFSQNIRGTDVFLIQSTFPPAENILELLFMIDAAKRASARRITVVIPYFGYARQDRKDEPRVAISSKVIAQVLTNVGAHRVLTMDLHAGQIQGFFEVPVDHLYASYIFLDYLVKKQIPDLTIVAPDIGSTKMASFYGKNLNADLVIVNKQRPRPNVAEIETVIGEVSGKNVLIVDDLIDTGGSMVGAAVKMMERGAKSVIACCSHAMLSGQAYEKIAESPIEELVVTDTIPLREDREHSKIKVISCASMFGEAIKRTHLEQSISSLFV
ncbi:ribose-phosphate pyrophosphokinase [bacterium]|nr:ribose-phosphate pyrophosphokinase [bacterium]